MKQFVNRIVRRIVADQLKKHSYIHIDEFTRPYIIQKNTEGVDFLFSIGDHHARLYYDLYCTDPVWIEMRFIRDNLVHPGDVVIECGSHHGCTTILLANWVGPEGSVYAYEPGRHNFEILKENMSLNNISNVHAINAAVGSGTSVVNFTEFENNSMGSKVVPNETGHNLKRAMTYEIDQVSLDTYKSVRPSLIKIDTQGYIYQPLLGLKRIIAEQKPNLALEIDGKKEIEQYGNNFEAIFEIIEQNEYSYFVQFEEDREPEQIEFSKILTEWDIRNNFNKEIHLYAKNSVRFSQ